jgi:predicted CXXCH cytochrome family protein
MTQPATPHAVIGDFDGVHLRSRERDYFLERRGDEFLVEANDPDWERDLVDKGYDPGSSKRPVRTKSRIVMTTGSHHMQTYWMASRKDGRLFNFPFVWLRGDERWAPREDVFLRPANFPPQYGTWHDNCVECHATGGESGLDPSMRIFQPEAAELGIACEACHGPAEEHVRQNQNPYRRYWYHFTKRPDPTIVNPSRLPAEAATYVCAQCHSMNVFRSDPRMRGERFRAGGDLKKTRIILRTSDQNMTAAERADWPGLSRHIAKQTPTFLEERFWPDGEARVSGRETNGMVESSCFKGGTLTCLSCHSMHQSDPNDQLAAGMDGDAACFTCHDEYRNQVPEHTHHAAESDASLCFNCHMPHTTYGLLKAIRTHLISSPTVTSSVETGRPNACNLCHLDKTLRWTADHLQEWYGQPAVALTPDQETVSASVLWTLTGDACQRALMAWHMGWEPAKQASGKDWLPVYLGPLLDDPYSCVRYIAFRSLRQLPGFEDFTYDFVASSEERKNAVAQVASRWPSNRSRDMDRHGPMLLVDASGNVDHALLARLAMARNDKIVDLRE